jgi:8-oxo-dGTP diphosphatase
MRARTMNTQPPTAIAVAVVRQGNRVLIGPRPDGVPLAGYWEFPGGKLLPKETPTDAAIRECFEETGMRIRVASTAAVVEHRYEHARLRIHFLYALPIEPESPPRPPFRWIPITELDEYDFPPANDAVLETLKTEAM